MNKFQQEIYKTIDILTEEKLKQLGFDKTKRGKVISINDETCIVTIDGAEYTCKLRKGIHVQPNDVVFVKFPQNNDVDKYVDATLGNNEIPEYLVISAEEILAKLKTVDGEGSGLDADMLDGKHASEFATKEDIEGISIDGDTIVQNINTSTSIIDDKNLSANVNDSISKKHDHSNKSILDTITQALIDGWNNAVAHISDKIRHITSAERALWNTVSNKSDKGHTHMESDIINLDKYTKAETDTKLDTKADKTYVDNELANKVDKITGKGLSTEDYTTAEKTKLSNIEDGAEKNKVNSVNSKTGDVVINKADIGLGDVENKSSTTIRNEITKTNVTNALGYTPENSSNKGVANGYAPLDSNIKIPLSMLPDIAKQQTYVVETIADRDNLTGLIMGEKCYITTLGDSYIWDGIKWVTLAKADWENVNLQWVNIVGKPQSNVADIDDATSKRHTHSNKSIIDTITQTLIDRWNSAWNHISDSIRHITSAERTKWNTVNNKADTNYVDTELNKKSNKGHIHTETDISDLDKYTKAETDAKLNLKQDKLGYTPLKEIPIASPTLLGGIKVGNNLTIAEDGTLSALSGDEKSTFIIKQETFIATEGQTLFNLTKGHYQPNTNTISVYLYGGKQPNIALNEISTSAFEFTEPLKAGTVVLVEYIELSSATPYPIHGNDHLTGGYDPIPKATVSSDGLMAKEDKAKLNTIEQGANNYIHPKTHSLDMITETADKKILTVSERNKITEIDNKVDKVSGKGLSDENYTLAEKNKLAGIATGATKNDTDANLKNRANHTGTQTSSTISDFASAVRNTVLTGLSTATNAAITATDTVLSALGKLQKQISDNLSILTNHIGNKSNPHNTTKSHVGLGNVDNTSDLDKPISTATQTALDNKSDKNHKHTKSEITDFPTSLPANGGNADTIGGKSADDFAKLIHKHDASDIDSGVISSSVLPETFNNLTDGKSNLPYRFDLIIYGDSDKYYPVHIATGNQNLLRTIKIWREYSELAPPDWYSSTHKGSLNLEWKGNYGGWGGAIYSQWIYENTSQYTTLLAGTKMVDNNYGIAFFLRGGGTTGAIYHIASDQPLTWGKHPYLTYTEPTPFYNQDLTFDNPNDAYKRYAPPPKTSVDTEQLQSITVMRGKDTDKLYEPKNSNIQSHISNKSNPHNTTKVHLGLGNVQNYGVATQTEAEAGTSDTKYMTPLKTKQAIDKFKPKDTSELNKSDVYTKTEINAKLNEKVDNTRVLTDVPANAKFTDTTYENATTSKDGLMSREDKTKLDGIESGANKYIHPSSHSASMIDETTDRKFMTFSEKTKLAGIEDGANKYTHPSTHPASMITESTTKRFVSDTEKANWNKKAEISDIPTKVGQLENDKNYVTQAELGNAGYGDMTKGIYDTNNNGIVDNAEKVNGFTVETNVPANAKFTDTIYTHPSTHPASMITGLHNVATSGIADKLSIVDTRSVDSPPSYYFGLGKNMFWEFKYRSSVGNPPVVASASGTYAFILTITGWGDSSGGYPVQISVGGQNIAIRQGISTTAWGSWYVMANIDDLPTKFYHVGKTPPSDNNLLWINTNL